MYVVIYKKKREVAGEIPMYSINKDDFRAKAIVKFFTGTRL